MKKKVSVALVLAIVLALLTIGALAALLGSKEFVGNVLAPKAAINASDKWTREEVREILRIAEENGIALSEENLARLQSEDGYFKEELMRLFAKVDLGFYPSTWSLEDQAWYDQLLVDCGLNEERTRFLPEAGEIGEEEALRIAVEYIRSQYDPQADVLDKGIYLRHVVYGLGADEAGNPIKRWDIEYM
ncbi:MAG TPA: hypothetical protein PKE04_23035, partial [Clostridia bacterium]|nr:hypothetical protein [Clostridia bacterium]